MSKLLFLFMLLSSAAVAQNMEVYFQLKSEGAAKQYTLSADLMLRQIAMSNLSGIETLHFLGKDHLYCQPEKLELTPEQAVKILETGISEAHQENPKASVTDFPISALLLKGLIATFPCKQP